MFKFLNKPYPFNDDLSHNTKVIFLISIGVFVFMFLFQPFELNSLELNVKIKIILGVVIVTFVSLSVSLLLLPSIHPKIFLQGKWNIKKEILWNIWILFTIMLSYIAYYHIVGIDVFEISMVSVLKVLLIALLPVFVLITINQDRLHRIYLKKAKEMNKKLEDKRWLETKVVTILSDYQKDSLSIKVNNILNIRSAGNYIEVFWKEKDEIKRKMIRTSLTKVEESLKDFDFIFKCHRSHLININHIEKVEGTHMSYKVYYNKMDEDIPVSRNFSKKLHQLIRKKL